MSKERKPGLLGQPSPRVWKRVVRKLKDQERMKARRDRYDEPAGRARITIDLLRGEFDKPDPGA
jgi:hypothetical protein